MKQLDARRTRESAMTYTILGRCAKTGRLGIGIATYSIMVGPLRPLDQIECRCDGEPGQRQREQQRDCVTPTGAGPPCPPRVLGASQANDTYHSYRQIGVIDRSGAVAAYTGSNVRGWAGEARARTTSRPVTVCAASTSPRRSPAASSRARRRSRTSPADGAGIWPRCGRAGQCDDPSDRALGGATSLLAPYPS